MTAGLLTTSPTRTQAMPTANPTGQMLGDGRCGLLSPPCGSSSSPPRSRPRRVYETDYSGARLTVSTTQQSLQVQSEESARSTATSSESSRPRAPPRARRRRARNHPLVLLALIFPVADRAALLLGLDGAPELSSAFCVAALGLERCEQPVYEQLPIAKRTEDGESLEASARHPPSDLPGGDLGTNRASALPPGEANVSRNLNGLLESNSMAWSSSPLRMRSTPVSKAQCLLPAPPALQPSHVPPPLAPGLARDFRRGRRRLPGGGSCATPNSSPRLW